MNDIAYNLPEFLVSFIFLSSLSVVPISILFLLLKFGSKDSPSPYAPKSLLLICIPGLLYGLMETIASRQELNFFPIVFTLAVLGVLTVFLIKKINLNIYVLATCVLVFILWLSIPKAMMKLF